MSINSELDKLKEPDIWSLMLFTLSKVKDIPEYSALSELAYILDKKNMFRLCEYFGGTSLHIPTVDELEILIYGLLLYQYVDVENISYDDAVQLINSSPQNMKEIKNIYNKLKTILQEYTLTSRSKYGN